MESQDKKNKAKNSYIINDSEKVNECDSNLKTDSISKMGFGEWLYVVRYMFWTDYLKLSNIDKKAIKNQYKTYLSS